MNYIVGLTGGIGSGKSTAAEAFARCGAAIVDADRIAHELTAPAGAALAEIRAEFGDAVFAADASLDRSALRRRVFADAGARRRLEAILHPRIRAESERRCAAATAAPYVVLVVPLLVESGDYRRRVHRVAVVDCDEATQLARVVARSGLTPEQVAAIMATQAPRQLRLAAADDVIDNGNGVEQLEDQVAALDRKYREYAAQQRSSIEIRH